MISAENEEGLDGQSDRSGEDRAGARVCGGVQDEEKGVGWGGTVDKTLDSMDVDSVALGSGSRDSDGGVASGDVRSGEYSVGAGGVDEEVEPRVSYVKSESPSDFQHGNVKGQLNAESDGFDADEGRINSQIRLEVDRDGLGLMSPGVEAERKPSDQSYKSLLSEFDEFVAKEKNSLVGSGSSWALSYGFEVGDMVWGKVKSHPWWPGHIFNDAFATSSVRRTRRDGYVLVAFFGDSSYGWFDPAELIPFDEHFAEKSRQTTSRTFIKAVEEATDEASRRCALGLSCRCRNAYNFRPTTVQGYFAVDVPDYEPEAFYSATQIRKARDSFRPREILAFLKQLALVPQNGYEKSLEFIKNRATVFAYRKAVFEEYDETYAQAFGVPAVRPSHDPIDAPIQPVKVAPRAPLSGPLVIAEALGSRKSLNKPLKVKDHSKKDKYLFKRRDGLNSTAQQTNPAQAGSLVPASYVEGSPAAAASGYILQKRAACAPVSSQISAKLEQTHGTGEVTSSLDDPGKFVPNQVPAYRFPGNSSQIEDAAADVEPSFDRKRTLEDSKERIAMSPDVASPSGLGYPIEKVCDSKTTTQDGFQQRELNFSKRSEGGSGLVEDSDIDMPASVDAIDASGSADGTVKKKKKKVLQYSSLQSSSENAVQGQKKKKKRKEIALETSSDHLQKRLVTSKLGASMAKVAGKLTQGESASREDSHSDKQKKSQGSTFTSEVVGMPPIGSELDLRQLLSGLHFLALDPFHGVEQSNPAMAKQAFLRFRSLVYQKSLVLAPPAEADSAELRAMKSIASIGAPDQSTIESVKKLPSSKLSKPAGRVDPSVSGRKRAPSDRREEIEAKRLKKISNLKLLTAEKKTVQKMQDVPRGDGREPVSTAQKLAKPLPKKLEPPSTRASDPTMLVMKFPPGTSLPTVTELKARFARFGPMDYSGTRVFWKSSTCRVVFQHKLDAQAAYKYANGNNSLFGNANVRYLLREVEVSASEGSEAGKSRANESSVQETLRLKDSGTERPGSVSAVQLKSCLKKPSGDDNGGPLTGNGSRPTARVKFMLGGEENTRQEQMSVVDNANNFNNSNSNSSFADGAASSSSSSTVAMVYNSKNFQQRAVPSTPLLPFPALAKPQLQINNNASLPTEIASALRSAPNFSNAPSTASVAVDISQQMISLLTRCSDVVNNLSGVLGYVPYHPL